MSKNISQPPLKLLQYTNDLPIFIPQTSSDTKHQNILKRNVITPTTENLLTSPDVSNHHFQSYNKNRFTIGGSNSASKVIPSKHSLQSPSNSTQLGSSKLEAAFAQYNQISSSSSSCNSSNSSSNNNIFTPQTFYEFRKRNNSSSCHNKSDQIDKASFCSTRNTAFLINRKRFLQTLQNENSQSFHTNPNILSQFQDKINGLLPIENHDNIVNASQIALPLHSSNNSASLPQQKIDQFVNIKETIAAYKEAENKYIYQSNSTKRSPIIISADSKKTQQVICPSIIKDLRGQLQNKQFQQQHSQSISPSHIRGERSLINGNSSDNLKNYWMIQPGFRGHQTSFQNRMQKPNSVTNNKENEYLAATTAAPGSVKSYSSELTFLTSIGQAVSTGGSASKPIETTSQLQQLRQQQQQHHPILVPISRFPNKSIFRLKKPIGLKQQQQSPQYQALNASNLINQHTLPSQIYQINRTRTEKSVSSPSQQQECYDEEEEINWRSDSKFGLEIRPCTGLKQFSQIFQATNKNFIPRSHSSSFHNQSNRFGCDSLLIAAAASAAAAAASSQPVVETQEKNSSSKHPIALCLPYLERQQNSISINEDDFEQVDTDQLTIKLNVQENNNQNVIYLDRIQFPDSCQQDGICDNNNSNNIGITSDELNCIYLKNQKGIIDASDSTCVRNHILVIQAEKLFFRSTTSRTQFWDKLESSNPQLNSNLFSDMNVLELKKNLTILSRFFWISLIFSQSQTSSLDTFISSLVRSGFQFDSAYSVQKQSMHRNSKSINFTPILDHFKLNRKQNLLTSTSVIIFFDSAHQSFLSPQQPTNFNSAINNNNSSKQSNKRNSLIQGISRNETASSNLISSPTQINQFEFELQNQNHKLSSKQLQKESIAIRTKSELDSITQLIPVFSQQSHDIRTRVVLLKQRPPSTSNQLQQNTQSIFELSIAFIQQDSKRNHHLLIPRFLGLSNIEMCQESLQTIQDEARECSENRQFWKEITRIKNEYKCIKECYEYETDKVIESYRTRLIEFLKSTQKVIPNMYSLVGDILMRNRNIFLTYCTNPFHYRKKNVATLSAIIEFKQNKIAAQPHQNYQISNSNSYNNPYDLLEQPKLPPINQPKQTFKLATQLFMYSAMTPSN